MDVNTWENSKLSRGGRLYSREIFPKKTVALLLSNLSNKIVENAITPEDDPNRERNLKTYKSIIRKLLKDTNRLEDSSKYVFLGVEYIQQAKEGRIAPVASRGMSAISKVIRSTLMINLYQDFDMKNAHPCFLNQYIKKYPQHLTANKYLNHYITYRERVLKKVVNESQQTIDRDRAKVELLRIINGGSNIDEVNRIFGKKSFVNRFYAAMQKTLNEFYHKMTTVKEFKKFKENPNPSKGTRDNPKGSTLNHFLIYQENKSLYAMAKAFHSRGFIVGSLCYDGLLLQNNYNSETDEFEKVNVTDEILREVEVEAYTETGFKIELVGKDFCEPIDMSKLDFNMESDELPTDEEMKDVFFQNFGDTIIIVNHSTVYLWDCEKFIWLEIVKSNACVGGHACDYLKEYYSQTYDNSDKIRSINKLIGSNSKRKAIGEMIMASYKEYKDVEVIQTFNRAYLWHIPIKNGRVIDLRTGEISGREPKHLFTYELNRDYLDGPQDEVEELFSTYMIYPNPIPGEEDLFDSESFESLKKALGYSLSGCPKQKTFFLMQGPGESGKSTFFNIIYPALGNSQMCSSISKKIILGSSQQGGSIEAEHQALEKGLRIGYCAEFASEQTINKSQLKSLTGDDRITFRPFGSKDREYRCNSKIWLFTNDIPNMDTDDPALLRRMMAFPFENDFSKSTTDVEQFKTTKVNNVFTWLINQSIAYYQGGEIIPMSERMAAFKTEIIKELDPLNDFAETYSKTMETQKEFDSLSATDYRKGLDDGKFTTQSKLYDEYMDFGTEKMKRKAFDIKILKFLPIRAKTDFIYHGPRVRSVFAYSNNNAGYDF
jgi:phage/plasmid-associated DNA primase